jgi:hypothetical protein
MKFNPDVHAKLAQWMARCGLAEDEIAKELGVDAATMDAWKKEHAGFAAALAGGLEYWNGIAAGSLMKLIRGYSVQDTTVTVCRCPTCTQAVPDCPRCGSKMQAVIRTSKHIPPNAGAVQFALKNRAAFAIAESIAEDLPPGVSLSELIR